MQTRHERKKSKKITLSCSFSGDKIEAMKQKARELSKMIGKNSKTDVNEDMTPPETLMNSENSNDNKPSQKDTGFSENNDDKPTTFVNDEGINIPSCSKSPVEKTSSETIGAPKSKRTHSKDLKKKSKIPYLVKYDVYREEHVDDRTSKKQDEYVLEKLFNKSGLVNLYLGIKYKCTVMIISEYFNHN